MSLMTRLRLSGESSLSEGTPDEVAEKKRRAYAERVRPARLEVARRNPRWTEIPNDLVPRNRGRWLVSAPADLVYQPYRGTIFQPHSVNVIADRTELAFYVDGDGELVFLERIPGTWTEYVERRERRRATRARA